MNSHFMAFGNSIERIASGKRIVSARDDPAGLAVVNILRANLISITQGIKNTQSSISAVQMQEGSLSVISDILIRMKTLAEQASTGSYNETQRSIMDNEYKQLAEEISRITGTTKINGNNLLDNGSPMIHYANGVTLAISKSNPHADFDFGSLAGSDPANAQNALTLLGTAIENNSGRLAGIGTEMMLLEMRSDNLENEKGNKLESISRIEDADMATEIVELIKNKMLSQSSVAMVKKSNDIQAEMVLKLLETAGTDTADKS